MVSTITITFEKTPNGTQLIGKCTCLVDRILKASKLYSIVYWSRVQVKSLAFQGLNLDKVRTLLYPLYPPLFRARLQHHHCPRCPHCYFINGFPGPPANTLMPSVPRDLNGAFRTPFSEPEISTSQIWAAVVVDDG